MKLSEKLFLTPVPSHKKFSLIKLDLLAVIFISVSLGYLEFLHPYLFMVDDSYAQYFPVTLDFLRHLDHGSFSTYNPYQMLGYSPVSNGFYALTYPPMYLSFFFSKYILKNQFYTVEVFAIFHIITGYLATSRLLKLLNLDQKICFLGAICYVMSGFSIVYGRMLFFLIPSLLWTPLSFICLIKILDTKSIFWSILNGIVIGVWFHAGNAQMWIYGLIFYFVYLSVVILTKKINLKTLILLTVSMLIAAAIIFPLFYLSYNMTKNYPPYNWGGTLADNDILTLLFPCSLYLWLTSQTKLWDGVQAMKYTLSYSGSLFTIISLSSIPMLGICFFKFPKKKIKDFFYLNAWLVCTSIGILLSMGDHALPWLIIKNFSPFNKFSICVKFLQFVNLLFVMSGGIVLQKILNLKNHRFNKLENLCIFLILFFIFHHQLTAITSVWDYKTKPYPPIPEIVKLNPLTNGRYFTLTPDRSSQPNFYQSLPHNLSSLYQVPSLHGHDNITNAYHYTSGKITKDMLFKTFYGYSFHLYNYELNTLSFPVEQLEERLNKNWLKEYGVEYILTYTGNSSAEKVQIIKNKSYLPLASEKNNPRNYFNITYTPTGMEIDISNLKYPSELLINFAYYPQMEATVDGAPKTIIEDDKGRMLININQRSKLVKLVYSLNLRFTLAVSLILLLISMLLIYFLKTDKYSLSEPVSPPN